MTVASDVNPALIYHAELGESPIWSERRRNLLWVDTVRQTLNSFDPANGENVARLFPDRVGFVVEQHGGDLFVGVGADVSILSPSGGVTKVSHAFDTTPNHRLNDAKFDSGGRLWVGLMDERLERGSGLLLCIDTAGAWSMQAGGLTLPNGLGWNRDETLMYVTDSVDRTILVYDFDAVRGSLQNPRRFVQFEENEGRPDGLVVADGGIVKSVLFDGSCIVTINENGAVVDREWLPVPRPTSCAFGPDGSLYVTTARIGLSQAELKKFPLSGSILHVPARKRLRP